MLLDIEPASGTPLYRQIVDQVRRLISGGQLQPEDELPSVRDVARQYAINPMTVSRAYSLMESEGLVSRQRGKPMRVRRQLLGSEPLDQRLQRIEPEMQQLLTAARQLDIPARTLLKAIGRYLEKTEDE